MSDPTVIERPVAPDEDTAKRRQIVDGARRVFLSQGYDAASMSEISKAAGVSNEWSKLAQQRLNSYIAQDLYPVQRDEIIDREVNP